MRETRVEARVVGPGSPGFLKITLGLGQPDFGGGVQIEVRAELIPAPLRIADSRFLAVIRDGEFLRVEKASAAWRTIEERTRAVLNADWDPIGVADTVPDEYDGYIAGIYSLLSRNAPEEEIAKHLLAIEVGRMGLAGASLESLRPIAAKLRALQLPLLERAGPLPNTR
jgi:hypothetical protein